MANLRAEVKEYCTIDVANGNFFTMSEDTEDTGVVISLPNNINCYPEPSYSYSFDTDHDYHDSGSGNLNVFIGNLNSKEPGMEQGEDDAGDVQADEKKRKDKFNVECLSYELQVGYRILSNMMSTGNRCLNKLFLYPVDDKFPETADYYEKIKEPMWMFKMKDKFEKQEYRDLTEFMADFRLMIENCYRFNGPDHFVSKKAQKLETMMKQKVALLSKDLRDKIAGAAANAEDDMLASAGLRRRVRNPNASHDDPSQQLLSQLRRDRELQDRVDRRQKVEDRKAMEHARIQEMQTWEDNLLGSEVKDQIKTMWELPQIGLFVYLCMESLGLEEEVTQYQIERGLAVPRECSDFRRLMTCLLSTQHQRKSLKSFMPYNIWNSKLAKKLDHFYKVLSEKNGNQAQTCYFLGLDTRAFKVMGKHNPLLKRQFHQLSYLKRVWILKNFCDYCMETQPALQKTIDDAESQRPDDVRAVVLGSDGKGYRYINFPMFTGKDIRIYKHAKHPEPSLASLSMEDWSLEPDKISATSSRCSTPVNRKNNRTAETPSTSLRARVLLQAAESVEASPARDLSRSGSEAADPNSSPAGGKNLAPQTTDTPSSSSKTKQTSSRKRKHGGMSFTKRKRLKTGKKELDSKIEADQMEGAKDETSEDLGDALSAPNVKSTQGSSTSENVPCDKLSNTLNCSGLDSPDKSTCGLSANCSREETDTPAKHSTSFNILSSLAVTGSSTDMLDASEDCESRIAQGSLSTQGCNNSSDRPHESSKAGGVNCAGSLATNVIKLESNDRHASDFSPTDSVMKAENADEPTPGILNGAETADRKTFNNSAVKMETDLAQNKGKMCDSVTPVKQELSGVYENDFSISKLNIKQEPGDRKGCKLRQELFGDKVSSGLKSEGRDESAEDSHSLASDCQKDLLNGKECPEVKAEPGNKEAVKEEEESDEEDLPDLGEIELVVESMEEMRELIRKLSNPDPIKKGRKMVPGTMKPCEEELVAAITRFHDELVKYERSLVNARIGMLAKLRKEVESYVEPKIEEAKAWDSECSQSSSEETEEETVSKPEANSSKPQKKTRQKSSTTALLSSAASKLSSMTPEENGDSNDSFELDISSRGRLRKRRVIPNNTEDTGLKKRKNLPNQDAFFSTSPATAASTTVVASSQVTLVSSMQQQFANQLSAAASNSTIRAQLASHTSRAPGQTVRLVAPSSDATLQTVNLENISSQNLPNIRFVPGTKSALSSRNTSHAQSSHPVIQQLLLNQTKAAASKTSSDASRLQQRHLPGTVEASRHSMDINAASLVNSSKGSSILASNSGAVVVTQVSTSVSQGGKQVLDLGSLSVTQLQQLVKNQAIQINTSAGGTTTLLLTTGLQHLNAARAAGAPVIQAAATRARAPVEASMPAHNPGMPGVSSMLTMINRPQMVVTSKPNSWLTIPTQLPAQTARSVASAYPQTVAKSNQQGLLSSQLHVNQGLSNAALQAALARTVSSASPTAGTVLMTPAQLASVAKTICSTTFSGSIPSTTQKSILAPRIISSLASTGSHRVALGTSGAMVLQKPVTSSFGANGSSPLTVSPDTLKSRIITVPLVHLSPSKKYASNVTVKTLIENQNRGTQRNSDEDGSLASSGESQQFLASGEFDSALVVSGGSFDSETASGAVMESLETKLNQGEVFPKNEATTAAVGAVQAFRYAANEFITSSESGQISSVMNNTNTVKFSQPLVIPLTRPLWVDTAMQSLTSAPVCTSEIILPTVNIKVPSPNTLPSLQHNKNGTTIVQSTKVPIPVASEVRSGDSLSPSRVLTAESIPQTTAFQAAQFARRAPPAGSNLVLMSANSKSGTPGSGDVLKLPASVAGLKNVTLKITPQGGSSGQFVQGFMTSQGLVIPQTALLQPNPQGGSVILGSTVDPGTVAQLNPNQVKIQPGSVLAINNQQNIHNLVGQSVPANQQLQQQQLGPQKVVAVANSSLSSAVNVHSGILSQNSNPGLKIMLVNTPTAAVSSSISSAGTLNLPSRPQKTIAAPASELVKQIANSSQLQRNSNHQMNMNSQSPGNGQQNTAYLLNNIIQGSVLKQANVSATVGALPPSQTVMSSSASINPQLTAQVLSLQQSSQLYNSTSQQYKPNIVFAPKPVQNQATSSSQNKPPVVTFQVQQLGQLISNLGGVTKVQMDGAHQVQNAQVLSVQKQVGSALGQSNQVVQLAINQPNMGAPQSSQVVRVTGQPSPQLQNQQLTHIQQSGNVVIQQQGLLPQQQSQGFIIQQPSLSQAVLGSNSINIQMNTAQSQISTIQQQLSKTLQQPATFPQSSAASKVHFNAANQIPGQQVIGMSQNPGLVLSHLQGSSASTASSGATQQQIQFVINSSNTSSPSLSIGNTSLVSSSSMLQVNSPVSTANACRITRTESAITPSGLNSHSTISGIPHVMSPPGNLSHAVIVGSPPVGATATSTANKLRTHMIIPSSAAGKFLISPVKVSLHNPQAVNPIKYVSSVQSQNPSSATGLASGLPVSAVQLPSNSLTDVHNQLPGRPAVIYTGHQAEKKEGKIAQILLSQPVASVPSSANPASQVVVSSHFMPASLVKLQAGTAGLPSSVGTDLGAANNSKTLLYKIGDQYFTNIQQMVSQTALASGGQAASDGMSAALSHDVQLLVPPSFIEASDQMLKQSSKSTTQGVITPGAPSGSSVGNILQDTQHGVRLHPAGRDGSSANMAGQLAVPLNGVYPNKTQFSFSLSGPTSLARTDGMLDSSVVMGSLVKPNASNQSDGGFHSQRLEAVTYLQNQHVTNAEVSSFGNSIDKMTSRRNTFSGGQDTSPKGAVAQRHLSADDSALTLEDQDEKEAALNLLTLANQPI